MRPGRDHASEPSLKGISVPRAKSSADWTSLLVEASLLCVSAGVVVVLRSWRVFTGGAPAARELDRMVSEKTEAGFELAGALASGSAKSPKAAARNALSIYGKRVRGNRKRLG